jgi:hypothetical protein
VLENKVVRRVFGPKRDEMVEGGRGQHNDKLHKLFSSSSEIRMIKQRRVRLAGHIARMRNGMHIYDCVSKARRRQTTRKT